MNQIPMVDLVGQYKAIEEEVQKNIQDICNRAAFIGGDHVQAFKKELAEYLNVKHVITCANGTDALQIALMALDLKSGDEVITTPFTFVATVEVIALLGLKPVFVDIDPRTFNLDVKQIEQSISDRTKCIIPVHLFGQSADMDEIMAIAKKNNLYVVEDNAQAIGGTFHSSALGDQFTGTIGDFGTTSFFPSKNLGCFGDGGALMTNSDELAQKAEMIANHGSSVRYYHSEVGVNSRLDNLQASVLRVKLKRLDEYGNARRRAAAAYNERFKEISEVITPHEFEKSTHVYHQYTLRAKDRDGLAAYLVKEGVSHGIYYPVPLHLQEAYSNLLHVKGDFPVSEQAARDVISLPMHTELDDKTIDYITDKIRQFYE
jgi:dTDP-4-amino-4,6-dideoxygalactose transaminase